MGPLSVLTRHYRPASLTVIGQTSWSRSAPLNCRNASSWLQGLQISAPMYLSGPLAPKCRLIAPGWAPGSRSLGIQCSQRGHRFGSLRSSSSFCRLSVTPSPPSRCRTRCTRCCSPRIPRPCRAGRMWPVGAPPGSLPRSGPGSPVPVSSCLWTSPLPSRSPSSSSLVPLYSRLPPVFSFTL